MHDKLRQATNQVVMVSPDQFGFNPQTAESNIFQHDPTPEGRSQIEVRDTALTEFYSMIRTLKAHDIDVLVLPSPPGKVVPDAVFPNNWFSHHQGDTLVIYPMLAENRRAERQSQALLDLLVDVDIEVKRIVDLSREEEKGNILEGTGSLVLDREHRVAFAMGSPRTTKEAVDLWCQEIGYEQVFFHAFDKAQKPIYHTNVVMSIGDTFVVACPESISDDSERQEFLAKLESLGKQLIPISLDQVYRYCGNILQLVTKEGRSKIILSRTALDALTEDQIGKLEGHGELVPVGIPTIETVGGGSARCMLAEIFGD